MNWVYSCSFNFCDWNMITQLHVLDNNFCWNRDTFTFQIHSRLGWTYSLIFTTDTYPTCIFHTIKASLCTKLAPILNNAYCIFLNCEWNLPFGARRRLMLFHHPADATCHIKGPSQLSHEYFNYGFVFNCYNNNNNKYLFRIVILPRFIVPGYLVFVLFE